MAAKLIEVREGVRDLWLFLVPPTFTLAGFLLVTYYLIPEILNSITEWFLHFTPTSLEDKSYQDLMEFYGINDLMPFLILFTLVFMLYLLQTIVLTLGHLLPGRIVHFTDLLINHCAQDRTIARWWSWYPRIDSPFELVNYLNDRFDDELEPSSSWRFWDGVRARYFRLQSTLKVLLAWVIGLFIGVPLFGGSSLSLERVFLVVFLICIAIAYLGLKELYALEQQGFARVRDIQLVIRSETRDKKGLDDEALTQLEDKVRNMASKKRWWRMRFFDTYELQWIYRTLIK